MLIKRRLLTIKNYGCLFLVLFFVQNLFASDTGYGPTRNEPSRIASWNFNDGPQGWLASSSKKDKRWGLTPNGETAYVTESCFLFWCEESYHKFHSNDNSQFWLVNSLQSKGKFDDVSLTSPNLDLAGFKEFEISFFHHFRGNQGKDDAGYVQLSLDGGLTWTTWKKYSATSTETGDIDNFVKAVLPVTLSTTQLMIRFLYDEASNDGYWAIDNIVVSGIPEKDCTVLEPVDILANFCAGNPENPIIELTTSKEYDSYTWFYNGVQIADSEGGQNRTISTNLAGTYSLMVRTENGCQGMGSITTAEELVLNGDFETIYPPGEETFMTNYQHWSESYSSGNKLGPEGRYAIDNNAHLYHNAFYGKDHTTGNGNFLMVNGSSQPGMVIWKSVIKNIRPNTRYYFSAWGMNLNPNSPAELQFRLNGELIGIAADLNAADKPTSQEEVYRGNWKQFYMPSWNSGSATEVVLEIVNNNLEAGGNDFGIDDISFGNLDPIAFEIESPKNLTVCAGHPIKLSTNIKGGRPPVQYIWTKDGILISTEANPVIENASPEDAGSYHLTVTDFYGCTPVTSVIEVEIISDCHYLNFDGNNDYITIGDEYNLNEPFTLEAWIKPHAVDGVRTVLSKTDSQDPESRGYALYIQDGNLGFSINGLHHVSEIQINSKKWQHVAVVYDGAKIGFYRNGLLKEEVALTLDSLPVTAPFLIGGTYDSERPWIPADLYFGWIEEVRIWKKPLDKEQLHFMMNQRIDNSGTFITGQEIPLEVPGPLSSQDLWGYYPLLIKEVKHNSQEHLTSHGIIRNRGLDPANGYLNNMIENNQENSAPLPYETAKNAGSSPISGVWQDTATWKESVLWDIPGMISPDGSPLNIVRVTPNFKLTSGTKNIALLGLIIDQNASLTVTDLAAPQDEYNPGKSLDISHYLLLDGYMRLMGESQLLQREGSILDEESAGYLARDQQGTASSYNYNYWTSPVGPRGSTNNSAFSVREVLRNGTDPSNPMPVYFNPQYHYADHHYDRGKALRISSYWLHKYTNSQSSTYSSWLHVGANGDISPGEGFTMKGTSGTAAITEKQNYTFVGKPYNGTIELKVNAGNDYLVGNPYPSAIDSRKFLLDNIAAGAGNRDTNIINGTLYFWDHFGGHTHYLQGYVGGYAMLNLSGGVGAIATDQRINATGQQADTDKNPRRYIPVGQAFYVSTQVNPDVSEITQVTGGNIIFRNSQRVFETEHQEGDQSIFKSQEDKDQDQRDTDARRKIFLKFRSPEGFHRQILVTEDSTTTPGYDLGYDAPMIENIPEDMFWIFNNTGFVIQAVPDFGPDRELPLAVKVNSEGEITIAIDKLQHIPENFEIHLKDTLLNETHDLRDAPFISTESPGLIKGRFSLVFPNVVPSEPEVPEEPVITSFDLYYSSQDRKISIENPMLESINGAILYNISGQELMQFENIPLDSHIELPIKQTTPGVYILKLLMGEGEETIKFIIK